MGGKIGERHTTRAALLALVFLTSGCCTSANSMSEPYRQQRMAVWRRVQFPQPGMLQTYLADWGPPRGGSYSDGNGGTILVYFNTFTCNRSGSYNSYQIGSATIGTYSPATADCVAVRESLYFNAGGELYFVKVDKVGC